MSAAGLALPWRLRAAGECELNPPAQLLSSKDLSDKDSVAMRSRFFTWLYDVGVVKTSDPKDALVRNLIYNFYEPNKNRGSWIFPMLSGKAILWLVQRGRVADAQVLADALLRHQQTKKDGPAQRSYGAFPSIIERKGGVEGKEDSGLWTVGDRYYSGDNLLLLEAFVVLYLRTKNVEYLNTAIGIGTWITDVMCKGKELGVWAEDHGAPMQFVSLGGDLANGIYGNVEMLWISALKRLGSVAAEPAYCRQAAKAYEFYKKSQLSSGAFLDHYDPGYPPQPYSGERWQPYAKGQVISDNVCRAALGACRMGDLDAARAFFKWLKPDNGGVPAYINVDTGSSGFESQSLIYFDVVSSGMLRSVCQWLGEKETALACIAFLKKTQDKNGGWYWGCRRKGFKPLTPEQAPIVGMWATADLSAVIV